MFPCPVADISGSMSRIWIVSSSMKNTTEAFISAAQNQTI